MEMNKVKLGEICDKIGSGATPRGGKNSYLGGNVSLIRSMNVFDTGFVVDGLAKINDEQADALKNVIVKKNDVLINITGASVARCCNAPDYILPARVNQHVSIIRPRENLCNPIYLRNYLIQQNIKDKLLSSSIGSSREAITKDFLEKFEIEIPDIQTQTSIAKVLSSLDDKIELNNKINKELENLAKTIYEYWFVQNADRNWEKGKLSEIANITMGQSPNGSSYNENGNGIIFYQGCTDFGARFPTIRQYTTAPTRFAEIGDILLSVRAPVGSLNFANTKCCIGRGLAALNSKLGSITHLYFILKDLEMLFKHRNTDGTTFGAITKDDLFSLPITKPPKDILMQFEKLANPIFDKQFEIAEESASLAQLRDFLLPLLMNGQVKV